MQREAITPLAAVLTMLLALVMLMASSWVTSPPAQGADDVAQAAVQQMYALAWGQVAHDLKIAPARRLGDFPPPTVYITPPAVLCRMYYGEDAKPTCPVRAIQDGDSVYVSSDLDFADLNTRSILLHEFVHYFQFIALGRMPKNACELYAGEMQAYRTERTVIEKANMFDEMAQTYFSAGQMLRSYEFAYRKAGCK